MPLVKSKSKKAIGENIKREESAGKPKAQSIAIALDVARKAGAKIPQEEVGLFPTSFFNSAKSSVELPHIPMKFFHILINQIMKSINFF